MFAAFRQSLHRLSRQNRSALAARTSAIRMQFECLESRCMLSVAPTSGGLLETTALRSTELDDIAIVMALGTSLGQSSGIDSVTIEAPDIFVPPFEEVPEFPHDIPGDDSLHVGWPEGPPWGLEPEPDLQPDDSPDTSGPGGFVDIGVPDSTTPSELFVDEPENQEADEVREMLSSLNYLPPDLYADLAAGSDNLDSISPTKLSPGQLLLKATTPSETQAASVREDAPAVEEVALSDQQQSDEHLSEGGMISLLRSELAEEPEGENAVSHDGNGLADVPVQMDKAHGKFQAFEVSAGDGESPPAPPVEDGTYVTPQLESALELTSIPDAEPVPKVTAQLNFTAGESRAIQESVVENIQVNPGTDERATRPLHVAIASFVAVAVHVIRAIHSREPEEEGPTTHRLRGDKRSPRPFKS